VDQEASENIDQAEAVPQEEQELKLSGKELSLEKAKRLVEQSELEVEKQPKVE
tara:strand:- start:157 stop:315 length:159 start_codon:yes stop_codon:yes gene_type:complete